MGRCYLVLSISSLYYWELEHWGLGNDLVPEKYRCYLTIMERFWIE